MFYKHNLKHLGVKYSFPELLNKQPLKKWCEQITKPSDRLLSFVSSINLEKNYHRANKLMVDKSTDVNNLFLDEINNFLKQEKYNKDDVGYFKEFLEEHFKQEKHMRVLITQLIGNILLNAQNSENGLKDDLKTRKIINGKQLDDWYKTLDLLSLAVEILNAASYSADDVFDQTDLRYGISTIYKKHGNFAGVISADILFHYLGNYVFYKTIREHEKGFEHAYWTKNTKVSTNVKSYSVKWEDQKNDVYVYVDPEQYMDVWEVWTWAWYMINSGQIRDLYEFNFSEIDNFSITAYANRAYRLAGGFIESATHLTSAFMGCGYWSGRQIIGKWAAIYGAMAQMRNDVYDYVVNPPSDHKVVKETHEDVSLGRVTLPLGYAYLKANQKDKSKLLGLVKTINNKKINHKSITREEKLELNKLIANNNGFIASKKLVYNLTLWALEEIMELRKDFGEDKYYWQLVAWTMAALNIINLQPEAENIQNKNANIFKLNDVCNYLKSI